MSNRGRLPVSPLNHTTMHLQYQTTDRSLVSTLCSFVAHCYPQISFCWIPAISSLVVFCPDMDTHYLIETDILSELNVKPYKPSEK